ncbi:hypothetical protein [Pseudonocardia xishanensis]|uniref:Alpha/beta hydrolase family protein n=1 Tax=Pseudonocardia xishanensis TaxID=630995 RepID=A0ABP8RVC0_9PSEU
MRWSECGPNLDCASYPVPVDHADPDGPTVPLALVRHRAADPAQRLGVLLVDPGGPGGATGDLIRTIDTAGEFSFVTPELAARYDVVGMDPRGVGESQGVRCVGDADRETALARDLDPDVPGGPVLRDAARRHLRDALPGPRRPDGPRRPVDPTL